MPTLYRIHKSHAERFYRRIEGWGWRRALGPTVQPGGHRKVVWYRYSEYPYDMVSFHHRPDSPYITAVDEGYGLIQAYCRACGIQRGLWDDVSREGGEAVRGYVEGKNPRGTV